MEQIKDFTSLFLFSLETQTTIGYGFSRVTEECPAAIIVLSIHVILGTVIEAFVVGVVFAKLIRPKERAQAIVFSRHAVINRRDGKLCFMFRVGDVHNARLVAPRIRVQFIQSRFTEEGQSIACDQQELEVSVNQSNNDLFFMWPIEIVHQVTEKSPLSNLSPNDLLKHFEIVVILEGTTTSTNMATSSMTSYIPSEILWGYQFAELISLDEVTNRYKVDYSRFNTVYQVSNWN